MLLPQGRYPAGRIYRRASDSYLGASTHWARQRAFQFEAVTKLKILARINCSRGQNAMIPQLSPIDRG